MSKSTVHLCVLFNELLPHVPSNNSPFLQQSMLSRSESTLQISNCGFHLYSRILQGTLPWYKFEFSRLAHWLDHCQMFRCFGRIQPVLESSDQACVASCNLSLGVLIVFLNCRCHALIWIVEQCCVVFASTHFRTRLSKFGVVFNTRSALCSTHALVRCE